LLPNVFGALVYGGAKHSVNRVGGVSLHIRHQVDAHRDGDAGVPKPFLTIFGWTLEASMWLAWLCRRP
jgi:hypothetical protein